MAYRNLYKPISQFVDPMSTEIAQELRSRFLSNYQTQSQVEQELLNLQAAPFENDQKFRDGLVKDTMQTLTGISQRGDYENMTMPVMNAAKRYNVESAPIKQNYQLYTDYQSSLKELYEKGELDYEDYVGTLELSTYNYKGLERDNQGNYIKPFAGQPAVLDPKIEKRINEALNGIVAEEHNITRQNVGVDGSGQITGEGAYTVKTEQGWKTVRPERVRQVMDMVMSDGQVQAYLRRKGEIRYGIADEEDLANGQATYMNFFENEARTYDEFADKANDEEEKAMYLQAAAKSREAAGALAQAKDVATLQGQLSALEAARMESEYRQAAESRFSYMSPTKDSKIVSWDQKYLKTLEGTGGAGMNISIAAPGSTSEYVSPSGASLFTKRSAKRNVEATIAKMQEPGYFNELLPDLTFDQLREMSAQDYINAKGGANPEEVAMFNRAKASQNELLAKQYALSRVIEEAGINTGQTPEVRVQSAIASHDRVPEILKGIKAQYGVDDPTALAYLHSYLNEYEANMYADPAEDPREYGRLAAWFGGYDYDLLQNSSHPEGFGQFFNENFGVSGSGNQGRSAVIAEMLFSPKSGISNRIQKALKKSDEELSEYIEGMSTRQYTPTVSTNLLGMSKGEIAQLNELFSKSSPHDRGEAFVSQRTGEVVAFDKILEEQNLTAGERGSDRIVSTGKIRFNPASPGPAGPTIEVTYEVGKDRIPVTAHIPMSQISGSPGINNWYASMGASFYRQAMVQRQHGVEVPKLTAVLPPNTNAAAPEGMRITFEVNIEEDKITVVNGPGAGRTMGLTESLDVNGFINAQLAQQGFTLIVPGE